MGSHALAINGKDVDLLAAVAGMQRGEHSALSLLFKQCGDRVYSIALRLLRRSEDAEEVVSDVFQQAWRDAHRYNPERGNVEAWLMRIAHSRSIDRLRRRAARPDEVADLHPDDLLDAYTPVEEAQPHLVQRHQADGLLLRALALLSTEQRCCISLAFLGGMSHQEIVERLGWPLGTVKSHVRRGMLALRCHLEDWGYEHEPN